MTPIVPKKITIVFQFSHQHEVVKTQSQIMLLQGMITSMEGHINGVKNNQTFDKSKTRPQKM